MTRGSAVDIRPVTRDEVPVMFRTFFRTMGFDQPGDAFIEQVVEHTATDRTLAAFDDGGIVGTTYSHLFELTVPGGGRVPATGVTSVGVVPTHRRRGILRELMHRQLTEARLRGEAAAILLASESVIYGRFGYGISSRLADLEIDPRDGGFLPEIADDTGSLKLVPQDEADELRPVIYERWRTTQPGTTDRPAWWWGAQRAERKPDQASVVVHHGTEGVPDGYAVYAVKQKWDGGLPGGTLGIGDLIALTPEAYTALWRHCLTVDLVRKVSIGARPVDEPLRWLLANPRALKTTRFADLLWLRPLDIERLLSTRTYRAETELVLEVEDGFLEGVSGRFRVKASQGGGACERTDASPDLRLPVRDLGAISLGGIAPSELARVGRVAELTDGALARADAAFSSVPAPWTPTWF